MPPPRLDRAALREIADTCVCAHLRKLSRTVTQAYDAELRGTGLRATQVTLLVALGLAGELAVTQLGELLEMDRTTLTRNLAPLRRDGLIRIDSAPDDARRKRIQLTARGAAALRTALPRWRKAQRKALTRLGPLRWERLNGELQALLP